MLKLEFRVQFDKVAVAVAVCVAFQTASVAVAIRTPTATTQAATVFAYKTALRALQAFCPPPENSQCSP